MEAYEYTTFVPLAGYHYNAHVRLYAEFGIECKGLNISTNRLLVHMASALSPAQEAVLNTLVATEDISQVPENTGNTTFEIVDLESPEAKADLLTLTGEVPKIYYGFSPGNTSGRPDRIQIQFSYKMTNPQVNQLEAWYANLGARK